jgi:hypothetical protein
MMPISHIDCTIPFTCLFRPLIGKKLAFVEGMAWVYSNTNLAGVKIVAQVIASYWC